MKKAALEDKSLVVEMLALSFEKNQSVNYIAKQDNRRKQRIHALMEYSFEICRQFGEVYISDDWKACALVLYPDRKKTTFKTVWLSMKLIFQVIGISSIGKVMKREALIKEKQSQSNSPKYYLWFIGVDPVHQHEGIGTKLLLEVLADAKLQNRKVFLETSTVGNLLWYQRAGLQIYDILELGYPLYFLNNLYS
ncbi:GNAT family N-acetyltransferase [Mucilaginibacter sp. cycad4]|uniref:GNAT family N-acetyltransferase n=1 Tax=Mucilaginibacter sp. cycad4 TaxID=3342096 RepID=UPI002AAC4A4F|nr:GNAT family N-acetyltransferase [Mucilaginibacter gossypii]WPV02142.1 GNAT family N-acetyltransferase [Mucilaginibacter gossypii]